MTDELSFVVYFNAQTFSTLFGGQVEGIEQWNSYFNLNIILDGH